MTFVPPRELTWRQLLALRRHIHALSWALRETKLRARHEQQFGSRAVRRAVAGSS